MRSKCHYRIRRYSFSLLQDSSCVVERPLLICNLTKLDERVLRDASIAGEGAYIPAGTDRVEMARAYEQTVGALERQEYEGTTVTRRTPRFQWFAGASFALLLAAAALPDRRAAKGGSR